MKIRIENTKVCLRCDREFNSKGPYNRICPKCKESRGYRGALEKERAKERLGREAGD